MTSIGKAFKHIFSPEKSDEVLTSVHSSLLKSNVDVNDNSLFGRIFSDDKGLGGSTHARSAQSHWAARRQDEEKYNAYMKEQDEALKQFRSELEQQQKDGDPASIIKNTEDSIKQILEKKHQAKRDVTFTDAAWGSTKDTFKAMNAGTAGQVATKWGAVGVGYAAVNGVGRALTGGGATYNASGERDIMGIPLV